MFATHDKKLAGAPDCSHVVEREYCLECYTELYYYTKSV